jgi:hypothetical protein
VRSYIKIFERIKGYGVRMMDKTTFADDVVLAPSMGIVRPFLCAVGQGVGMWMVIYHEFSEPVTVQG